MKRLYFIITLFLIQIFLAGNMYPQWIQTNGPLGGRATSLAVKGEFIFAGFDEGGIYRSSDNGANWTDAGIGVGCRSVTALHVSGTDLFAAACGSMYLSTDNGTSWARKSLGLETGIVNCILENEGDLFTAASDGVYRSTNHGENWTQINNGLTSSYVNTLIIKGTNLYAGTWGGGIFKSVDNGNSWLPVNTGLQDAAILSLGFIGNRILAQSLNTGLFISENEANSWTPIVGPNMQIQTLLTNGVNIYAGGYGITGNAGNVVFQSNDGLNWVNISNDIAARDIRSMVLKDSRIFAGCYYSGIYTTNDFNTGWSQINNGIKSSYVLTTVSNGNDILCGTTGSGILAYNNDGDYWTEMNNGMNTGDVEDLVINGSVIYAGTQNGVYRSLDNAGTWQLVRNNLWIKSIVSEGTKIYAGGYGVVLFSSDSGNSWSETGKGALPNSWVYSLGYHDNLIYAGTSNGIFISSDDGTTWSDKSDGLISKDIRAIDIVDSKIFVGTFSSGIWMSSDKGNNWGYSSQLYQISYVETIIHKNKNIFASSGKSVFQSTNLGETWSLIAPDFPLSNVNSLTYNDTYLFAGLGGAGVWKRPLSELINYSVSVKINLAGSGIIFGAGTYSHGSTATVTAAPNEDYKFINWTENGTVISTNQTYQFTVMNDRELTANFEIVPRIIDTLTILHINDTHSMLAPRAPRTADLKGTCGGIARAATVIGMTKMSESHVLTVHAGDVFIGDLFFNKFFGIAEFQMMNALGFDALVLGNHEFDVGPEVLQMAFDSSLANGGFDVLSANTIHDAPEIEGLKKYVKHYTVKELGNIKIGIFGLTTPSTNLLSMPSPAVIDTNLESCISNCLGALIGEGCNLIICLSHLGTYYDEQIASTVPGINVIISAHDHRKTAEPIVVDNPAGKKTYIVEAGAFYSHIGKLKMIIDAGEVSFGSYELIKLDQNIPEEPGISAAVDNLISDIEATYGAMYSQQIGYAQSFFEEEADSFFVPGSHSTPVGNLVTDAFRAKTGTDVAIIVGGATAQPLYEGPIVPADVFRMIGYGFNEVNGLGYRLVKFNITGPALWAALQVCLAQTIADDEFFPQVSGMTFGYNTGDSGLELTEAYVNGVPVNPASSATYTITTNEFLAYALQNVFRIPVSDVYTYSDSTEFQAVIEYIISQGGIISPNTDPRVTPVDETGNTSSIPTEYKMEQNYPNPFNPSTTFSFSIPGQSFVTLKIYNVLGKEVATVVNEQLPAGNYKYEWNAAKLASGVYFYKMQAGKYTSVKKLMLMK